MPYKVRKKDCKQSDGKEGTYIVVKKKKGGKGSHSYTKVRRDLKLEIVRLAVDVNCICASLTENTLVNTTYIATVCCVFNCINIA